MRCTLTDRLLDGLSPESDARSRPTRRARPRALPARGILEGAMDVLSTRSRVNEPVYSIASTG